ncbi:Prolipoprotein diacylglyceryl transferase [Desulfurobacterium thermolithotrophum DSM 11699]|uniref:Phosphatidylglycerol--prolipoprotein diacylglyceryl transferase n=1 Tax=Desulfurobacterium thermolithotrophum (strain DSM 11699 / BSA) TaxID=868864 RepID=F0S160_DESTD|nr:prolipoprotein diacylglyceryl transferase [Desulfurobacterium thermolithotrophum]ADY73938.1 Prolipoprotein diacylglyceryl transferase [Desulfurobacterium thermolithotrophum DSM 11699]
MYPILFKIGPITIYTYGVMVALGIFFGSLILMKLAEKEGIPSKDIADTAFWTVIAGIIGARVFFFLYNPQYLDPWYRLFFFWEGGLVWYGGVIFGALTAVYFIKKRKIPFWKFADIVAIPLSVGLGFGRIGCTMAGCCYGKECDAPFAIIFHDPHSAAPLGIPLYPTQPISSAANFLIAGILYLLYRRKKATGEIFGFYLIFYGIFRFLIEFWRATPKEILGMMSNNQVISIIMVATGLVIVYYRRKVAGGVK